MLQTEPRLLHPTVNLRPKMVLAPAWSESNQRFRGGCRMPPKIKANTLNKVHFACFACRKAFKQPESSNWNQEIPERPFDCPDCKRPMVRLGRYFKAPPRRARRQWLTTELLFEFGERFVSGNSCLGQKCRTIPLTILHLVSTGHEESVVRARLRCIQKVRQKNS